VLRLVRVVGSFDGFALDFLLVLRLGRIVRGVGGFALDFLLGLLLAVSASATSRSAFFAAFLDRKGSVSATSVLCCRDVATGSAPVLAPAL